MDEVFRKELDRCTRCGKCRSVCPVFGVSLNEADVARGRLFITSRLDGTPSRAYLEALARCLLCGACEDQCPASVPVTELTRVARSHHRLHTFKEVVFHALLPRSDRLRQISRAGVIALRIAGKALPDHSGLRLRFGVDRWLGDRRYPKPPTRDFLSTHGTKTQKHDVALFAGCTTNYLMPQIGVAALDLLKETGIHTDVPADQACCGLMAFGAGDLDAAKACARSALKVFSGYKTILSLCASCTTMLKVHLPEVMPEAADLASRVVDIHSFLLDQGFEPRLEIDESLLSVAYHAPCHFRFAATEDAPLRLLKSIPGLRLAEIRNHCCGFGGSFALSNPHVSVAIGAKRALEIERSGARTVVTSCSGCLLGIYDGIKSIRPVPHVMHPLELLAKHFKKPDR